MPVTSILVPVWQRGAYAVQALHAADQEPGLEILVHDNASGPYTSSALLAWRDEPSPHGNAKIYERSLRNIGKGAAVNDLRRFASGDWIVSLDGDVVLPPGGLAALRSAVERGLCDVAAAVYEGGSCMLPPWNDPETWRGRETLPERRIAGGCLVARRKTWDSLGGYTGDHIYGNDDGALIALAARRGVKVAYVPACVAKHLGAGDDAEYQRLKIEHNTRIHEEPGYRVTEEAFKDVSERLDRWGADEIVEWTV